MNLFQNIHVLMFKFLLLIVCIILLLRAGTSGTPLVFPRSLPHLTHEFLLLT